MKPVFAKILDGKINDIYGLKVIDLPYFSTDFHFHEECQLTYTIESEGSVMIGDSIANFNNDELIFVGSNLPHVWHNSKQYFKDELINSHARSVSLFIHPEKILHIFREPENIQRLKNFFLLGKRGMKFGLKTKTALSNLLIKAVQETEEIRILIVVLEILNLLCHTKDYHLLSSPGYTNNYQLKDNDKMDKILKYIFDNFNKVILLDEAADMCHMNKHAFCRYFKSRTQKTFVTFVNEVRIGHACKLLTETDQQISDLAYCCGFNNLSNFNKFFKMAKGVTPRSYRKMLWAN
ncbi:AraC family transcriptional regulator [Pedobacter frigiditerrae]|uniref:AraC family transcriptional regulator n=1 Tax=Pedobacter frigiditerrae TaxID=2530452 RepID=A0A4R0MMI7_9SPHI|nr:AraC family transcriptional regulator [Pedobacter frigiditerrae]TCC87951.1 AraC family transcriptional regulator [Pedobacter frigiditerrae]